MQLLKEKNKGWKRIAVKAFLGLYILAISVLACVDRAVPEKISVTRDELNASVLNIENVTDKTEFTAKAKLFGKIPIKTVEVEVMPESTLIPCGNVFGVKFFTKGVMIIRLSDIETGDGFVSPAKKAGLKTGDVICSINGTEVNTAEEMAAAVESSKGKEIVVVFRRDGKEDAALMKPVLSLSDRKYKTGIWVRDSTAGIGTMTYYNPETGEFAGLGHGICDVDTGELMPLLSASVVDVEITDIVKGRRANPGELKGNFDTLKKGKLSQNTVHGVYGIINSCPENVKQKRMKVGLGKEMHEGHATILCEIDENGIKEYKIKITKIKGEDDEGKNFVMEIADETLLSKTGGIVQGMSGSPVIQDGKLVGAVTHVLVNNPTKGYGIFIENMLSVSKG